MHHFVGASCNGREGNSYGGAVRYDPVGPVGSQLYRRNPKCNIKAWSNKAASQAKHDNNGVQVAENNSLVQVAIILHGGQPGQAWQ